MARPMPRLAPVMNSVLSFSVAPWPMLHSLIFVITDKLTRHGPIGKPKARPGASCFLCENVTSLHIRALCSLWIRISLRTVRQECLLFVGGRIIHMISFRSRRLASESQLSQVEA